MSSDAPRKQAEADTPPSHDDSKEEGQVKGPPFSNYWRILSFGTRTEHAILCVATLGAAASGVALPLMNIIFGSLVGNFNGYADPANGASEEQFTRSTNRNALFFVYLFIGKFILTYIGMFCFRTAGLRVSAALRLAYLEALFSQPIKKLDEISTGTVANTITTSANEIQASISDRLSTLFQSIALVIAAYGIAFRYSWALTLAVSSGILFVLITLSITTPLTIKAIQRVAKADEKHATVTSETVSSIRTVFALGAESRMIARHSRWVAAAHKDGIKVAAWTAIQLSPFFFTTYASFALAFWFGLKLYREGSIGGVSNVIVVFFSVLLVTTVLGQIAQPIVYINRAISASTSFFDIMDSEKVPKGGLKGPDVTAQDDIELNDITFAYPTRSNVMVLKSFSATFRQGKTTALVGPSGSGKSTVVALLERWYSLSDKYLEPTVEAVTTESAGKPDAIYETKGVIQDTNMEIGGSILVGGVEIEQLDLRWWRSQIGLVQQEPFLFNDTIANNIAYGLIGTIWEDAVGDKRLELIRAASIEAFADEFISKLPQGYDTKVGEGGIKLSGGQRQRIAIARSIVRKPAILILDEATSAIDVQGEQIVQKALDRASQNRTTIMIAHRLSTIRKADHIIVLRKGEKVEEGTHEGLLSNEDGLYNSLVRAQKIEDEDNGSVDGLETDLPGAIKPEMTRTSTFHSMANTDADTDPNELTDEERGLQSAPYQKKGLFRSVGSLVHLQRSKWYLFIVVLLSAMGCGAAYALQSWFFAQLVLTFQYTGQQLVDRANFWALMFFILALAVALCYSALTVSSGVISTHIGTNTRRSYFRDALKMPITYFDRDENSSGSVMQRLSSDPKQVQDLLGINSAFPLISIFNMIGSVIISFYFGWKLTLVTFFAVTPVILGASFLRTRHEVKFEANNSKVFLTSSQFATEATGAFRTVSSLGMEDVVIEKYRRLLSDQIKASTHTASYAMLAYALSDSIELCGMALTFWYGGQLLASREYNAFQFFVIYSAIVQGTQAAGQYLSIIPNIAYATASANRILELRSRVRDDSSWSQREHEASNAKLGAEVSFRDVAFRYPGHTTLLFSHLNINIQAGQFVAFVGASGCGKTTTISMLERFYDPDVGTILIDGEDISTLDIRSHRKRLALVSQEPRLFSGTIKDNLLLGVEVPDTVSEEQIFQACKDAEIHDFIISLPDGYNTDLGQNTQTALSGGQKQRLCLARALLRRPRLLLLDEATSSLDSQSEKLVQGAIERLAGQKNMTVIAVAHRLATIQKADTIFVFGERDPFHPRPAADEEGAAGNINHKRRGASKILERGSHNELFAKRGIYWSMCKAQALDR